MQKKLKILLAIPNFDTAGSGKVVYDLAKNLDKSKFEVAIACDHDRGAFFKKVKGLEVPVYLQPMKTPYRPYHSLFKRLKPLTAFIRKHNFDLVHSWNWSSDWTEVLATRLAGTKYVYTKKAMSWGNKHWKIKSFLANYIITINDEMRGYFPYKKRQELIPLGLDTGYYSPSPFTKEKNGYFEIITVANLVPVKGIEVLLSAVKRLKGKQVNLTILGDDQNQYGKQLKKNLVGSSIEQQVSFLGKKNDVRPFLAQADLYVIPTLNAGRKEGMPMALVEAMSMAVPVLGSDISGITYVLKDFPDLLFSAGNDAELAKKIESFRAKPQKEKTELAKKLRQYCEDNFSMKDFITQHETLYKKLTK